MKIVLARNIATHASICHTLKYSPSVIAQLTFWQIANIIAHPRTERGEIKFPDESEFLFKEPKTTEEIIAAIQGLARMVGPDMLPPGEVAKAEAALRAKGRP